MALVYLIGLTGGIASGKSTVAERLAEHGAVHIDADALAREVVEPGTEGLRRIRETFGSAVLRADGSLDRSALGGRVFGDKVALARLNEIVHPAVRRRTAELMRQAGAANADAVVVYDVPLLVEAGVSHPFDLIVVVHASEAVRVDRMVRLRGMTEADASNRIRSQAGDAERLAVADVVIDSDGTLEHTLDQADDLWAHVSDAGRRPTVSGAP
ncbi:MAG: dephospho-CoA kinase [Cryobacterium sp.]|jgi:dephospho-CoA kinase|nr:dephospho-CoA kinase [Cryobacterium sp.]